MENDEKKAVIASRRGRLENELYAAQIDVKVAEEGPEDLQAEPKRRLAEIEAQIAVLDKEEKKLG